VKHLKIRSIFILLFLIATSTVSFSQDHSGALHGVITNRAGALISNAVIAARNVKNHQTIITQTNADGEYRLTNLAVGKYEVRVRASQFRDSVKTVNVKAADPMTLNFELEAR
jgi:predicted phage tail protein